MRLPMSPALALLSLMACGQRELTHLSADEQAVIFSANELALDLMAAAPSEENLFIGSFSITSALGMTYAGAAGQTALEMADVMHVNVDDATFHTALGAISRDLNGQHKGYDLLSGNRLWGQKRLGFEPDFLEITASDYGAELKELDFARDSEGARRDINRWVSRETNGHIDEALRRGDVDRDTRLALTNVMYVDEEVSVLRLPYKGEEISFVAILPAEPDGLAALEEGLSVSQLDAWLNRIDGGTADVDIQLPKFSMSDRLSLKPLLQDLGMPLAFDPQVADFSGMTDEAKLSIEDVTESRTSSSPITPSCSSSATTSPGRSCSSVAWWIPPWPSPLSDSLSPGDEARAEGSLARGRAAARSPARRRRASAAAAPKSAAR